MHLGIDYLNFGIHPIIFYGLTLGSSRTVCRIPKNLGHSSTANWNLSICGIPPFKKKFFFQYSNKKATGTMMPVITINPHQICANHGTAASPQGSLLTILPPVTTLSSYHSCCYIHSPLDCSCYNLSHYC